MFFLPLPYWQRRRRRLRSDIAEHNESQIMKESQQKIKQWNCRLCARRNVNLNCNKQFSFNEVNRIVRIEPSSLSDTVQPFIQLRSSSFPIRFDTPYESQYFFQWIEHICIG